MKEKNDILSTIGKDSGFKVPENYFSDFAEKMRNLFPTRKFSLFRSPLAGSVCGLSYIWLPCLQEFGV